MAFSNDDNLQYGTGDIQLTSANGVVMPAGTTSYTVASNHSAVIVRKVSDNTYMIRNGFALAGNFNVNVQPNDVVWDVTPAKMYLKYSTGGNSFVNFINFAESVDPDENDGVGVLVWNGEFRIN